MRSFDEILEIAVGRHGEQALADYHGNQPPKHLPDVSGVSDDRWLSMATRCIFQAGFNWKVVEAKWDGFEAAFEGFDVGRWVLSTDDDISRLASDTRIIRNPQKIKSVPVNAQFIAEVSREHGGFGKWISDWPSGEYHLLLETLHKRGSRLGAMTGQYFLRFMQVDSYILSRDVTAALIREGVIDKPATSKKAKAEVQAAFNVWMEQSGRGLTDISRVLARSIDA